MSELAPVTRNKCLRLLYRTCGQYALLPRALKVPVCYNQAGNALYKGGYADVWKGKYRGQDVAVKIIRVYSTDKLQKVINVGRSASAYLYADDDILDRGSVKRL